MRGVAALNRHLRQVGGAATALAHLQRELRAAAVMQLWSDRWMPLATAPVPLDPEDDEILAAAARQLTAALLRDPATALYGDAEAAFDALRTPKELRPFVRAEIPHEVVLSRSDFLLGPDGWQANEVNIGAGLGGLMVEDYDACVARQPLLEDFFTRHGYAARAPIDELARAVHRRCARLAGGTGRPLVAIVDWEGYDAIHRQQHERMAELLEARGFATVVCHHRQLRFEHGRLRVDGRPIDVVHREFMWEDLVEDPDSALPVLRAAEDGITVLTTGFRAEWQGQKLMFGVLHQALRRSLLSAADAAAARRHVPETWPLTPELLADGTLPPPEELVLKPSIGSMSQGVRLGADTTPEEFRQLLRSAAAQPDAPHVAQRLIPPTTVPFPHLNAAQDAVRWPESQISVGAFVVDGETAGAWAKVCPRSAPTVMNNTNDVQWSSVRHPAARPRTDGGHRAG